MLKPDHAFGNLRRQAKQLDKAEDAAASARREVNVLAQASADVFAALGAITNGDQPRCDPTRILADADRETGREIRLRLTLPSGTAAAIRAQRVEKMLSTAASQARQRVDRLERAARIAESEFTTDALDFLAVSPIAAQAFAAAMALNGIQAREDRWGETAVRFRKWITGAGIGAERIKK